MHSLLVILSITSFWMFSPEALVITGNAGGVGAGLGLLVFLCFCVVICIGLSLVKNGRIGIDERSRLSQKKDLVDIIGAAGMIGTALFASTGILVTAGFTFNEVIYYRFPNFAFAYILLAAVLAVAFFSETVRETILVTTMCICFVGITTLVVYGLVSEPVIPYSFVSDNSSIVRLLPLLLVFIGIDQINIDMKLAPLRFWIGFGLCVLLLSGWMYVSTRYVDPNRLMVSTIPYMIAAGKIGGELGRMVMAFVIIAGSFGAVYGLNRLASSTLGSMVVGKHGVTVEKGSIVLLVVAIAAMMGAGVAGTDLLEVYIRSSLLLWLAHTALTIFSSSIDAGRVYPLRRYLGAIVSGMLLLGSLVLFVSQKKIIVAVCFAASMVISTVLLGMIIRSLSSFGGSKDIQFKNNTEV